MLLDYLGRELIGKFKDDYQLLEPSYLKVLIERIMSLEFKDSKEALEFFKGIKELSEIKNKVLKG